MKEYKITDARSKLYSIVSDVNVAYNPIKIVNTKGENAVILSERDWNSIEETLYLNSIPGLVDNIQKIIKTEDWSQDEEFDPDEEW